VKNFLSYVHDCKLCLDQTIEINTTLISKITRIPQTSKYPGALFAKVEKPTLSEEMKEKFGIVRGKRGLDVQHISNKKVRFET
jgi:hypothetical protein